MADLPVPFLVSFWDGSRVRGLGFALSRSIVTLEHIASSATRAEGADGDGSFRTLRTAGGLALVRTEFGVQPADLGRLGGAVTLWALDDVSGRPQVLTGRAGPGGDRRQVTLDSRLSEDWTVAGSPIVADGGVIIGIAGPTATSTTVDAFGPEAIRRLLAPDQVLEAMSAALVIVDVVGPAAAALLSALRVEVDIVDADRLGAAWRRFAGDRAQEPAVDATADDVRRSPLAPIYARAGQLGGTHPLLAAALSEPEAGFPEGLFDALGTSYAELRDVYRPEPEFDLAGGISSDLVDPTTGIPLDDDHLSLGVDVTMFAALIADTDTPMPLSVGLFGEWGSGKSYFMALLRAEIARLAASPDPRYRSEIVQIGFNAWHYADSNLWASLGDEIFEQLAGPQAQTTDEVRDALRRDLDERLQRRAELKAANERAAAESKRLAAELDRAAADRHTSAKALAQAVLAAPALRAEVEPALDRLGVKDDAEQLSLLAAELERAPGDAGAIHAGVPRSWIVLALLIAIAAIAVGVALGRELAGAAAAVLAAIAAAGAIAARVRSGARLLHEVADGVRTRRAAAVEDELDALRRAETTERLLQTQLDEVVRQVGELSRELAELTPGQRLYRFVTERAASETYRGQLGLISTIRKDFEQLNALMKEWRADGAGGARRPIDRIVLYIDDLDRCSPEQVVEVLQAVHLLLAIDLFVVVVGVDPRWLLHSLRREYRSLLTTTDGRWESTPQDYLEKIFNIPFALPRMTATSFGQLVESFVEVETPVVVEGAAPAPLGAHAEIDLDTLQSVAEEHSEVATLQADAEEVERRGLTQGELAMLTALAPLVETPRETKRLVNVYRMLRSTRDLSPAARFLGDEGTPGEYQAVVILLGLLSGHARLLHEVLAALLAHPRTDTWAAFAATLPPELAGGLARATALVTLPDLAAFQAWAPRIARFSFLLSPLGDE